MSILNLYQLDKRHYFLFFTIVLLFFVCFKAYFPAKSTGNISMNIIQNKTSIININQTREPKFVNHYKTSVIDFTKNSNEFFHPDLGTLGVSNNFFVDFETKIVLDKDIKITFDVYSDDGFNLFIDNQKISTFEKDRPINLTSKEVFLKKGTHDIKLQYFQGGGLLGIKAYYLVDNDKYLLGENSTNIIFKL